MPSGQYPTIYAGQDLTASLLQSMVPQEAWKITNTSAVTSATLVNDLDLVLPVVAAAVYDFSAFIAYEGNTTGSGDLKAQWTVPAGASLTYQASGGSTSGFGTPVSLGARSAGTAYAYGTDGSGVPCAVTMTGTLIMGSTAGSLQLQWAENTANATGTLLLAGCRLKLERCA